MHYVEAGVFILIRWVKLWNSVNATFTPAALEHQQGRELYRNI